MKFIINASKTPQFTLNVPTYHIYLSSQRKRTGIPPVHFQVFSFGFRLAALRSHTKPYHRLHLHSMQQRFGFNAKRCIQNYILSECFLSVSLPSCYMVVTHNLPYRLHFHPKQPGFSFIT